jgi:hypothetical protein
MAIIGNERSQEAAIKTLSVQSVGMSRPTERGSTRLRCAISDKRIITIRDVDRHFMIREREIGDMEKNGRLFEQDTGRPQMTSFPGMNR